MTLNTIKGVLHSTKLRRKSTFMTISLITFSPMRLLISWTFKRTLFHIIRTCHIRFFCPNLWQDCFQKNIQQEITCILSVCWRMNRGLSYTMVLGALTMKLWNSYIVCRWIEQTLNSRQSPPETEVFLSCSVQFGEL